ncbi:MAG TPA: CoA-binding protein [Vicinamibacterales bacterium]
MNSVKTVAVIGASSNRNKFGNKALRAFAHKGYTVFPINPTEPHVEGHAAFKSVLDVPTAIDMATLYVPGDVGLLVLDDVVQKGIPEVWLNPGADDREVVEKARALGLKTVRHCSILAIGDSPSRY